MYGLITVIWKPQYSQAAGTNLQGLICRDQFAAACAHTSATQSTRAVTNYAPIHAGICMKCAIWQVHWLTHSQYTDSCICRNARVIGQAFHKFIIAECEGLVICFDQHAADERVRVEAMQRTLLPGIRLDDNDAIFPLSPHVAALYTMVLDKTFL